MRRRFGMSLEANAKKIEDFALVPIGRRPDAGNGLHDRIRAAQLHAQPQLGDFSIDRSW